MIYKKLFITFFIFVSINTLLAQNSANTEEVNITKFGLTPESNKDASRVVREALEYCSAYNIKRLIFPKGRYDFYPDYTFEKFMFISNNNDGLKNIAFLLENMDGFEIDGQGSEFVFHGYICPFILDNTKNISLKNFSIDYARTFHSEGKILKVGKDYFEVSFSKDYPYKIENERLVFTDNENDKTRYPFGNLLEFDAVKKETAFKVRDYYVGNNLKVEKTGENNVRVYLPGVEATVGNVMVFAPNHRNCPAITVNRSDDTSFDHVNLYHSGGMGIIAQMSHNITMDHFKATLSPNHDRVVDCTADATHFSNCTGAISIDNSLFENHMDDATNVHGIYMRIDEVVDQNTVMLRLVHGEQLGMDIFNEGQMVELVDAESVVNKAELKVKALTRINQNLTKMEFEKQLPKNIKIGDVVGSTDFPEVSLRNSIFQKNRARGVLLGSRRKTVVEGNYFHVPGAAIMTGGDTQYWFEQGGVTNLFIRNNVFEDCNYGVWGDAVIQIDAGSKAENKDAPRFNQNVVIENNEFKIFDPRLVSASSVDKLIFKNNKIAPSNNYPIQNKGAEPFVIMRCTNVYIEK